jgi:hypothetical protein
MREDETATVNTLSTYRDLMVKLIEQHHGRVVDSPGDNLLAEFASVVDAVQGAVAIQRELKARNTELPFNRKMEYRIGINLGDIIVNGERIYGDGVNIAARLEGLAEPGGICISQTAFDQIEDKLPLGYEFLGAKIVKNIPKPVRAYRVLIEPNELIRKSGEKASDDHKQRYRHLIKRENEKKERREDRDRKKAIRFEKKRIHHKTIQRRGFSRHLSAYVGVIALLFIINILTFKGVIWFYWPALIWGLGIYLHWFHGRLPDKLKQKGISMSGFNRHLGTYIGVIGFLLVINVLTYEGRIWFHWPALFWGLFLFMQRLVFSHRSVKNDTEKPKDSSIPPS